MIDHGLGIVQQPPAQTCCSIPMALCVSISTSQDRNWPYSFQSAMEVQWQLLVLWDIWRYTQDGFLEVSQPSTDVKGKPSALNCWSVFVHYTCWNMSSDLQHLSLGFCVCFTRLICCDLLLVNGSIKRNRQWKAILCSVCVLHFLWFTTLKAILNRELEAVSWIALVTTVPL